MFQLFLLFFKMFLLFYLFYLFFKNLPWPLSFSPIWEGGYWRARSAWPRERVWRLREGDVEENEEQDDQEEEEEEAEVMTGLWLNCWA